MRESWASTVLKSLGRRGPAALSPKGGHRNPGDTGWLGLAGPEGSGGAGQQLALGELVVFGS